MHQVLFGNYALPAVFGIGVFQPPGVQPLHHHVLGQQWHQRHQLIADKQFLDKRITAQTDAGHHHEHEPGRRHFQIGTATKHLVNRMVLRQLARAISLPGVNLNRQRGHRLAQKPDAGPDCRKLDRPICRDDLAAAARAVPLLPERSGSQADGHAQPVEQGTFYLARLLTFLHQKPTMIGFSKKPLRS